MKNNKEKETLKEIEPENDFIKLDESSTDNRNSSNIIENNKRIKFDFSLDSEKDNKNTEEKHIEILNNKHSLDNEKGINNKNNYKNISDKDYKSEDILNNNKNKSEENYNDNYNTLDESVSKTLVNFLIFYFI